MIAASRASRATRLPGRRDRARAASRRCTSSRRCCRCSSSRPIAGDARTLRCVVCGGEALPVGPRASASSSASTASCTTCTARREAAVSVTAWPCAARPTRPASSRSGGRSRTRRSTCSTPRLEPVPGRRLGRAVHRRRAARARLPRRGRSSTARALRRRPVRRPAARCTAPATSAAGAATALIEFLGRARQPGQAARLPHRARRDRVDASWTRRRRGQRGDRRSRPPTGSASSPHTSSPRAPVERPRPPPSCRRSRGRSSPEYMVPAIVHRDRTSCRCSRAASSTGARCRRPSGSESRRSSPSPRRSSERAVAAVWASCSASTASAATTTSSRVGGHSLLAARLVGRVSQGSSTSTSRCAPSCRSRQWSRSRARSATGGPRRRAASAATRRETKRSRMLVRTGTLLVRRPGDGLERGVQHPDRAAPARRASISRSSSGRSPRSSAGTRSCGHGLRG